jgi:methenyltetrahydromethanopterin cyclohydrolase
MNNPAMTPGANVSLASRPLVQRLLEQADSLRVGVIDLPSGTRVVDAGIDYPGGLAAGRLIAEICLGGLGCVSLRAGGPFRQWPWQVDVHAGDVVRACLGSQYAGWSLSHGTGKQGYNALGSGPARAMGSKEPLLVELGGRNPPGDTCLVVETDRIPPTEVVEKIIRRCGIAPAQLTLILTPTTSLAGGVQIAARVLEVALHKVHELHFPLASIVDGAGTAPLPPPSGNFMTAMGRTNDAILYGGFVHLFVNASDADARELATQLPSSASRDFGRPFGQVFKDYQYDFYKIDPLLFSPAAVAVTAVGSGRTFHAGALREDLLDASFGG